MKQLQQVKLVSSGLSLSSESFSSWSSDNSDTELTSTGERREHRKTVINCLDQVLKNKEYIETRSNDDNLITNIKVNLLGTISIFTEWGGGGHRQKSITINQSKYCDFKHILSQTRIDPNILNCFRGTEGSGKDYGRSFWYKGWRCWQIWRISYRCGFPPPLK